MNNPELNTIIYLFLFILLLIMTLIGYGISKSSKSRYLFKSRLKRIDWLKFGKMYVIMILVLLFGSIGNPKFFWYDAFILSGVLSYMVIFYATSMVGMTKEESEYLNNNKISINRDIRLGKLLKNKFKK